MHPSAPLTLKVEDSGSAVVLRVSGDLDLATIGQVMATVDRIDVARSVWWCSTFEGSTSSTSRA